jgi:hypothetical protein
MPHRWRLQLAGLFALTALTVAAAFALFPIPERLELPLSLTLMLASILAGWNLYRWISVPRPPLDTASTSKKRHPFAWWRQLLWFCLQLAVVGFCAWLWAEDQTPDRPSLGLVLLLAATLAIVLTALAFIIKDVILGQWRLWSDHRRTKTQEPDTASPTDDASSGTGLA